MFLDLSLLKIRFLFFFSKGIFKCERFLPHKGLLSLELILLCKNLYANFSLNLLKLLFVKGV